MDEMMNTSKKKLLVLGGASAQVPLITTAQREGYYVVLCDFTTTNPGIAIADKHYQENFRDKEKVLEIALAEQVQGVISNSELAMPVVAFIAEKLGLVGNSVESIMWISSKAAFRQLQKKAGVYAPQSVTVDSFEEMCRAAKSMQFPLIMKPCQSSGSRGTEKLEDYAALCSAKESWEACSRFSFDHQVVIEDYVEMPSLDRIIDGDIFVMGDHILWDGLFTSKRSEEAPMIPMTQTYPPIISDEDMQIVVKTIEALLKTAGIRHGEYNIELFFDREHRLFCIEINPRQGGNGIPVIVRKHCSIDFYRLLITTVMGDNSYYDTLLAEERVHHLVTRHLVYPHRSGVYEGLYISDEIRPYIDEIQPLAEQGTTVKASAMAADKVAIIDLRFQDRETQLRFTDEIEKHIYPVLRSEN